MKSLLCVLSFCLFASLQNLAIAENAATVTTGTTATLQPTAAPAAAGTPAATPQPIAAVVKEVAKPQPAALMPETSKESTANLPPPQIKEIIEAVRKDLEENPEILIAMGQKLQKKEHEKQKAAILDRVIKYKTLLFDAKAPGRLVFDNPKNTIILVEFTQHQCRHCKDAAVLVDKLLKNHPEVQLITIYWPFFGPDAAYTAKAVFAAQKQNKAKELNQALFTAAKPVTKNNIDETIKSVPGLDAKKLYADLAATEKDYDAALKENLKLAQDLDLIGTPSFVFANKELTKFNVLPGQTANFEEDLNKALNEVK